MAAFDFGNKFDPQLFEQKLNASVTVNAQDYVRQGWEMFKDHIGEFVGFTLIIFVGSALSSSLHAPGSLIFSAIAASFYAGYSIIAFMLLTGQPFQFGDFFRGFNYFLPLFLSTLAGGILVSIGLVFLIVPGIYLAVGYICLPLFLLLITGWIFGLLWRSAARSSPGIGSHFLVLH